MWGLVSQGVKCQDCGFQAHKKCSERTPPDCEPQMRFIKRVFGVDLTTLVKATNSIRPVVVEKCIEEIEKRKGAIECEGLYRVSGFSDAIDELKLAFDRG
jgi:chimaerin